MAGSPGLGSPRYWAPRDWAPSVVGGADGILVAALRDIFPFFCDRVRLQSGGCPRPADAVEASRASWLRSRLVACFRAVPAELGRSAAANGFRPRDYLRRVSSPEFALGVQELRVVGNVLRVRCSVVSWDAQSSGLRRLVVAFPGAAGWGVASEVLGGPLLDSPRGGIGGGSWDVILSPRPWLPYPDFGAQFWNFPPGPRAPGE